MPAKLEINLKNLEYNITNIRKYIKENSIGKNIELLAMVKADAYGAGMLEISRVLERLNINYLGVAYLKEAKLLRENNIKSDIIVFSGILKEEIEEAVNIDAIYAVSNMEIAELLNNKAKEYNKKVRVHIAIDTGMGRLGATKNTIHAIILKLKSYENLIVEGIFSHFSSADLDMKYTKKQADEFNNTLALIKEAGIKYKYAHICNSIGILKCIDSYNNMVRIGIGMYGYLNNKDIDLKGIFKLSAPICDIREIEENSAIGYSQTYITKRKTKVATIQIGYADGFSRILSNKYSLKVKGKDAKILGNICMDMTMIDVTDIDDIHVGDYVNIFDFEDGKINEIADICNTINYEIISTIGKRVDRYYIK